MTIGFVNGSPKERLSALADGEVDCADAAAACGAWKSDVELRRDWHAWQLIGDVLRSEDLAIDAARDRRFLAALRARLAPSRWCWRRRRLASATATAAPTRRARPWLPPARSPPASCSSSARSSSSARAAPGPARRWRAPTPAWPSPPRRRRRRSRAGAARRRSSPNSRMIRDPRLERYLEAHKQFAGTSALGVPSAFLRSATVDAEPR